MGSVPGRNKRLESAISILLLTVLLLIGLGVFIRQFDVDMGRFGIDTTTAGPLLEQTEPNTQEPALDALMPDGFKEFSETETYDAGNLYEKINGKAPLYTDSGFEKLFTKRFISKDDENLWMELYVFDMAAIRNAFSVYSVQRRADADILSLFHPSFGYRTDNALYFVHGKYYVELIGSAESTQLFKAMTEIAGNITSKLKVGEVEQIAELSLFPDENAVLGSAKLYLADAFGFDGLTDIFVRRYKLDDETISAFLSKRPDSRKAEVVAESYRNFLIENGATTRKAANKTLEGKVLDFYDTTEIVLSTGPFVVGIHEAENQRSAEELAVKLIDKLSNSKKR
ncbi:hypothetical protein ES703_54686 [subsurface metagenome]